jgi:hypothetical protein
MSDIPKAKRPLGIRPNHASADAAWPAKPRGTLDNAQMRCFIVHLHRLLGPERQAP